jgi:hypothetical protein
MPVIVFFAVATCLAVLFRGMGELRARAVARRAGGSSDDLCQLRQANRITSRLGAVAAIGMVAAVVVRTVALL